jgi:hypothetical protein
VSRRRSKAAGAGGYRRLLRWAGLPITDRRWAAPLSALALGFGLFVGVAIGPGASGTLATNAAQVIEIPGSTGGAEDVASDGGGPEGSLSISSTATSPPAPLPESGFDEPVPFETFEPETPVPAESGGGETGPAPQPKGEEKEVAEAQVLAGTVVHVNPAAGSYTLAEAGGTLNAVHAADAPPPGAVVKVSVRLLANRTFAEAGKPVRSGSRRRATFDGIVTYADPTPTAPAYVVSKRGVSLLVHVRPDPTGAAPTVPALGAFASVTVDMEIPEVPAEPVAPAAAPAEPVVPEAVPTAPVACAADPAEPLPAIASEAVLWQHEESADGPPFTYSDFAGIVVAVCPETGLLSISSDDIREGSHDIVLAVPATIDTKKLKIGQSVTATATFGEGGSLTLSGLASDERAKGADDFEATQGDLAVEEPPK